jgi:hypothetical protein
VSGMTVMTGLVMMSLALIARLPGSGSTSP